MEGSRGERVRKLPKGRAMEGGLSFLDDIPRSMIRSLTQYQRTQKDSVVLVSEIAVTRFSLKDI